MSMIERGLFFSFEGMDGSGKSTQLPLLVQHLEAEGYPVLVTVEPGGTEIGKQIRRILLDSRNQELRPTAELLLYFAARAQNVDELIMPALAEGTIVIADRFTDSTLAYQGVARGLGADVVRQLDRVACRGLKPDFTFCIDIDLETSLARAHARNRNLAAGNGGISETRIDEENLDFHRKVRDAYHALAASEPDRVHLINGGASINEVAARIWTAAQPALAKLQRHV
ncbi:MAG: dTMP kinase [Bryobacteraceae bacterium]